MIRIGQEGVGLDPLIGRAIVAALIDVTSESGERAYLVIALNASPVKGS